MGSPERDLALVAEYARGLHHSFMEAVRRANEAVRQRDFYRRRAIEAECALREATGRCPDWSDQPCPTAIGLRCDPCGADMDKEARYL